MPASTSLVCTASLESMEGRKAWVVAEVMDRPGGVLYASGRALFVIPKDKVGGPAACHEPGKLGMCGWIRNPIIVALGMQMLPPSKASKGAAFAASQENGDTETETEVERLSIAT